MHGINVARRPSTSPPIQYRRLRHLANINGIGLAALAVPHDCTLTTKEIPRNVDRVRDWLLLFVADCGASHVFQPERRLQSSLEEQWVLFLRDTG